MFNEWSTLVYRVIFPGQFLTMKKPFFLKDEAIFGFGRLGLRELVLFFGIGFM